MACQANASLNEIQHTSCGNYMSSCSHCGPSLVGEGSVVPSFGDLASKTTEQRPTDSKQARQARVLHHHRSLQITVDMLRGYMPSHVQLLKNSQIRAIRTEATRRRDLVGHPGGQIRGLATGNLQMALTC
jgi:hypothetical protein